MVQTNYQDRIVRNRSVLAGKPVVKGTRVPVELVLRYLSSDLDVQALLAAFRLTPDDVKACLSYARELVEEEELFPVPNKSVQTPNESVQPQANP